MKWILIVMWFTHGKAAISVEFNDKPNCMAAASEIQKQSIGQVSLGVILCAAKGEEKK